MIKQIDIINLTHTDFGFTDHRVVCDELLRKYVDIAIDKIIETMDEKEDKKFYWTAETLIPILDWWVKADTSRRADLKKAIEVGQFEAAALPFNNTPFLNKDQWKQMLNWVPPELWKMLSPKTVIQNDVNGFPRAGALACLNRNVKYMWSSINTDSGGAPLKQPAAFWWKMPDGRRMFVWLNLGYCGGYDFLEEKQWRQGPIPEAADCLYWLPGKNDILKTDEKSMQESHKVCQDKIGEIEKYYPYERLAVSITNQWRMDTDPPLLNIPEFVNRWNQLGLQPMLRFTTVTKTLKELEKEIGDEIPEYRGEWTDWWANGTASAPRELSASRKAKRIAKTIKSPIWGEMEEYTKKNLEKSLKELCMFDEHTWGAWQSVSEPYSVQAEGQFANKSVLAYQPLERLKLILSKITRNRLLNETEGLYIINPSEEPYKGWEVFPTSCLRDDYLAIEDNQGKKQNLVFENGWDQFTKPGIQQEITYENVSKTFPDNRKGMKFKIWVDLKPCEIKKYKLIKEKIQPGQEEKKQVDYSTDEYGWPEKIEWLHTKKTVQLTSWGKMESLQVKGFNSRWLLKDIREKHAIELREKHMIEEITQPYEKVKMEENKYTIKFIQLLKHSALNWYKREIEIYKYNPRINITVKLNKKPTYDPQTFYTIFELPLEDTTPYISNGGSIFKPGEQLPNTCQEYYAIDGWVYYRKNQEECIWTTRDASLVSFGGPTAWIGTKEIRDTNKVFTMLYNNFWYTNFRADSSGIMEFRFNFELRTKGDKDPDPEKWAEGLMTEPVKVLKPKDFGDDLYIKNLIKS